MLSRVCTSWTLTKISESKATGHEVTTENTDQNIWNDFLTIGIDPTSADKQDENEECSVLEEEGADATSWLVNDDEEEKE